MFPRRKRRVELVVGEKTGVASFCASIGNAASMSEVEEGMQCSSGESGGKSDVNTVESAVTS